MLQRAASNAFSWWWASHIRTKQSKWLEQSLLDMEDKVHYALNIVQKDGDSFGKRAEMYYRHRPDLICFIEETFRAYRSLAERYDKLSRNLQKANTTIASIFPDQVSYDDFDDDDSPPIIPKSMPPQIQGPNAANIQKVPQLPNKNLKGLISNASKKMQLTKTSKEDNPNRIIPKSGLSKEEAIEEIDKIQKEILSLQTTKEFTKSLYENGLCKYWEIDNKINTMQQKVRRLQDEFKVGKAIEDGDARTVMAQAALKSCKETLEKLIEKQENSSQAAMSEHEKIVNAKIKINALKRKFPPEQVNESQKDGEPESQIINQDNENDAMEKIKESLDESSKKQLRVSELANTIDKIANKVISLESTVSSQTANIDNLRNQASELQTQIQILESDKASKADGALMRRKLKNLDKKLQGLEDLEKEIEKQNHSLKVYFMEANCRIEQMSEKLHDVQPDEEVETDSPASEEEHLNTEEGVIDVFCNDSEEQVRGFDECVVEEKEIPCMNDTYNNDNDRNRDDAGASVNANLRPSASNINCNSNNNSETARDSSIKSDNDIAGACGTIRANASDNEDEHHLVENTNTMKKEVSNDEDANNVDVKTDEASRIETEDINKRDQRIKETGDEPRKNPLKQYTTNLKNYKETKKKLSDEEKKKLGTLFELIVQVRELKTCIVKRDNEIQMLKQQLNQLQDIENWPQDLKQDYTSAEEKEYEEITLSIVDSEPISEIEEKFRTDIDVILDENLDFWLRFSTQFHQVQNFKTEVEDLKREITKVKSRGAEAKSSDDKTSQSMFTTDLRSDIRPIYKHLKEIQSELTLWIEQAENLKDELQTRCTSLSNIQEEITMALKEGMLEDEIKFSTHQAAKFQGEILNMEQQNNRVNEELEAGLDHVRALHLEIKKTLRKLEEELGLSDNQKPNNQETSVPSPTSRPGIPLRNFIFGVKAKKQKPSIFNVINKRPKGGRI
ncbi:kinase-interacting protein 1-like [Bidens hawaiensis]|uniref:kinase-interacting protein 1-like n=1 Tax=Bidens hawaiensis TaxID=980011 RepID=UPI00404A5E3E